MYAKKARIDLAVPHRPSTRSLRALTALLKTNLFKGLINVTIKKTNNTKYKTKRLNANWKNEAVTTRHPHFISPPLKSFFFKSKHYNAPYLPLEIF